jgi:hypothetical protein
MPPEEKPSTEDFFLSLRLGLSLVANNGTPKMCGGVVLDGTHLVIYSMLSSLAYTGHGLIEFIQQLVVAVDRGTFVPGNLADNVHKSLIERTESLAMQTLESCRPNLEHLTTKLLQVLVSVLRCIHLYLNHPTWLCRPSLIP